MHLDPKRIASSLKRRASAIWKTAKHGGTSSGQAPDDEPQSSDAPDDERREPGWWDLLPFTTHRIELAPGLHTCGHGVDASGDLRTHLVVEACGGSMEGRSVVDLGCLEGGFTLAFASLGSPRALGIEAREISVRRADLARDLLGLNGAEFVVADIKDELVNRDPFDVVFAAGILYHVADPAELLRTMRAACSHMALIDTHVAGATEATHGCSEIVERTSDGVAYSGRLFPEYAPDVSTDDKEGLLWAAYSDVDSFWPLEDELVKMITDAGFSRVEKVDPFEDGQSRSWGVDHLNRVIYRAFV